MTRDEFRETLDVLGFSQSEFARVVARLGGGEVPLRTVQRWATGAVEVPVVVSALLNMLLREDAEHGRRSAEEANAEARS